MATFDSEFKNHLLEECESAKYDGLSVKEILQAIGEVLAYILEYWL